MVGGIADEQTSDLIVAAGAGLDVRLGRRLAIGVAVQVTHAFPLSGGSFDSIEIPVRISYHWYPGWFRRLWVERLDD